MEKCNTCMHGYPNIECVNCGTGFRNYLPYTPPTNADRIRHMSDEELAWFITLSPEMEFEVCLYCVNGNTVPDDRGICLSPRGVCVANDRHDAFLDWLRQPVKEEHNETD